MFRIARDGVLLVAFFALLLLIVAKLQPAADVTVRGPFYAIDGDTLAAGDERLRLVGLDAPELDQRCGDGQGAGWACGREARHFLAGLVRDANIECRASGRDRYHRLLVTCRAGATSINASLVRKGLAVASGDYQQEQSAARSARQGIWSGDFEMPREWRASRGMMEDTSFLLLLLDRAKGLMGWNE
jgi:endonuclease YncB( thermonuclease family)